MKITNLHTHSTFCDGKDSLDEIVKYALSNDISNLGMSSHFNNYFFESIALDNESVKEYIRTIRNVKNKNLKIWVGIEMEYGSDISKLKNDLDYVIAGVHYLKCDGKNYQLDNSEEELRILLSEYFGNDFLKLSKLYYKLVSELATNKNVDIIAHLDLITKFNENEEFINFSNPRYLNYAYECVDKIIANNKIIEINTGAMARGYRSSFYPNEYILKYIAKKKGKICLSSDCHDITKIYFGFKDVIKKLIDIGFEEIYLFNNNIFMPYPLRSFI